MAGYGVLEQTVYDPGQFVELDATLVVPQICNDVPRCMFAVAVRNVENANGNDWLEDMAFVLRGGDGPAEEVLRLRLPEDIAVGTRRAQRIAVERDARYAGMRWVAPSAERPTYISITASTLPPGRYSVSFAYWYTDASHTDVADRAARELELPGVVLTVAGR
jgi:hypothetical protein